MKINRILWCVPAALLVAAGARAQTPEAKTAQLRAEIEQMVRSQIDDQVNQATADTVRANIEQALLLAQSAAVAPRANDYARVVELTQGHGSFLGVDVCEVNRERMRTLNLKEERGVEVTRVQEDSPAAKAGLKTGDVVLDYNGQRVEGTEQFIRLVRETPAGREVKVGISRNGQPMTLTVAIGTRKGMTMIPPEVFGTLREMPAMPMIPDMPRMYMGMRNAYLGIEAESLSPQLAEYFGVKEGVLVRSVQKGTAAEKAGIKAGDVITKVDNESVSSPREITSSVRDLKDKRTFPVTLYRDKREMTVTVTLDQNTPSGSTGRRPVGRPVSAREYPL